MAAPEQNMQFHHLPRLQGSAKMAGMEYEFKMAGLVALRARAAGLKFRLHSNVRAVRPFDDLVLQVLEPRPALFLVQLKHSNSKKSINAKALTAPSGQFSLRTYFGLFLEPPSSFSHGPPLSAGEEQLQRAMRGEGARLVLYTNGDVERRAEGAPRASAEDLFLTSRIRDLFIEDTEGTEDATRVLVEDLFRTGSGGPCDVFAFDVTDMEVWQLMKNHGQQKEDSYQLDFLSKFLLFSQQSDADDIDDLISAEIKQLFGGEVPGADRFLERYLKFLKGWAQDDSQSYCLSECSPQLQMEQMLADEFRQRARAAAGGFAFGDGACAGLRAALGRSREGVLRVAVPGLPPGLRAAKAQQVLDADFPGAWTYLDSALLEEHPLAALLATCSSCDVVVLDTDEDIHKEQFKNIEERSKTLVILCANDCLVASQFVEIDCWRMGDLKKEVQDEMMEKPVLFQGHRVPLRDLGGAWPRLRAEVDGALLAALARGAAELGAALPAPGDESLHVPRTWEHGALLDPSVLEMDKPTEHLVLSGFGEEAVKELRDKCGEGKYRRWTLLATGAAEAAFREVASNHLWNVHWVHLLRGRTLKDAALQWKATEGEEAALAPFVRTWSAQCVRRPLCAHAGPPWGAGALLLVGAAGAGKTCALRRAAAETRERAPARWVVFVEILLHLKLLRKLPPVGGIQLEHAVDLLAAAAGVAVPASRRHLEAALAVSGGVSVFIDGVDEVSPFFKDSVLRLLTVLKQNTDNPIWVSCRPEVEASLQQEIGCSATRLRALSREEQRRYLCEQWAAKHHLPASEFTAFADKTIHELSEASDGLLDVPLHLSMAAEVLAPETPHSPDAFFQKNVFVLLLLYRQFIQMKEDIYLQKHGLKDTNWENLNIPDFKKLHQNSAMLLWSLNPDTRSGETFKFHLKALRIRFDNLKCNKWIGTDRISVDILKIGGETMISYLSRLMNVTLNNSRIPVNGEDAIVVPLHKGVESAIVANYRPLWNSEDQNNNIQIFKTYVSKNIKVLKKEKSGVLWLADGKYLHFAHFTFAEFFCALWLFEHRVTEQAKELVKYLYLNRTESLAVRFLDLMLVEESRERVQLPLHEALLAGDGAGLARALEEGARADAVDAGGRTALHLAAWRRNWRAMEALLEAGCDAHRTDSLLGWTPMHYANVPNCGRKKQFMYRELCRDICKTDCAKVALWLLGASEGCLYREMLVAAAYCNARKVSRSLLTEWDVGACGAHGERPKLSEEAHEVEHRRTVTAAMKEALIRKHEEIALELLEHVSDEDKLIWNGESALHLAARGCLLDITKRLLKKVEYASVRDWSGRTPLQRVFRDDIEMLEYNAKQAHYVQTFLEMLPISMYSDHIIARDSKGHTPLHLAVEDRHASALEKLLTYGSKHILSLANIRNGRERTPLHVAASRGNVEAMRVLLTYGADPNSRDNKKCTPLHLAAQNNSADAVKLLIEAGSHPEALDEMGQGPLNYVYNYARLLKEDRHSIVALLLEKGSCPNTADQRGWTPLHHAVFYDHTKVVERLVKRGAFANVLDESGRLPLHYARSAYVVNLLLRNGIRSTENSRDRLAVLDYEDTSQLQKTEVNARDKAGRSPLHEAAKRANLHVTKRLVTYGAKVNAKDINDLTPLHLAAGNGAVKVMNFLVNSGADTNSADNEGRTPLHLAALTNSVISVRLLIEAGSHPVARDNRGQEPLNYIYKKTSRLIQKVCETITVLLLERGSSPNIGDENGQTLLHHAVHEDHFNVVERLLKHGASSNIRDEFGRLPLHYAESECVVNLLLRNAIRSAEGGRDVLTVSDCENLSPSPITDADARDNEGRSPLHLAAKRANVDVVEAIVSSGSKVNAKDGKGLTPLHLAAKIGTTGVMKFLVASGADTNSADNEGRTPLHLAAKRNSLDVVRLLIEAGSDPAARDHEGQGPLNYVYKREIRTYKKDRGSIVALLLQEGSPPNIGDENGQTPLHHAVCYNRLKVVERLLAHNAFVDVADYCGRLPLHYVWSAGAVALLLGDGARRRRTDGERAQGEAAPPPRAADANAPDAGGLSPLHLATLRVKRRAAKALVAAGSDPNARDCDGCTPLHMAVCWKNVQVVRLLLDAGARYDALDNRGIAPLNYLHVDYDYERELYERMESDFEDDFRVVDFENNEYGEEQEEGEEEEEEEVEEEEEEEEEVEEEEEEEEEEEREFASESARIAGLLLGRGADPSSRDESGRTALHRAALKIDLPLVRVLLQHRVDVELLDNRGQTARDLAQEGRRLTHQQKVFFDEILLLLKG